MIIGFSCKITKEIYDGKKSRVSRKFPSQLHGKAKRLLDQIDSVSEVELLRIPPANKLKKLGGDLKDFWRIKIDKQWAIIFKWEHGRAYDVQIIDYH